MAGKFIDCILARRFKEYIVLKKVSMSQSVSNYRNVIRVSVAVEAVQLNWV
jgi:hypothetical protein